MTAESSPDLLIEAVRALASVCDGAHDRDGHGFNGIDASFGKSLARTPDERWTHGRRVAAYKMIRKYKAQLLQHGINYDQIPEPREEPKEKAPEVRKATLQKVFHEQGAPTFVVVFHFPYNFEVKEAVKGLVRRCRFDPATKTWWAPFLEDSFDDIQRVCADWGFAMEPAIAEAMDAARDHREWALEASIAEDAPDIEVEGLGGELRGFQKAGVAYAARKRRCFIADEMGTGKTIEALATIQYLQARPALVVCPASVKLNWFKEGRKWLPDWPIVVLNGPTSIRKGTTEGALWIVNYDMLAKYREFLSRIAFQALVIDECHFIKNRKAQRAMVCRGLALGMDLDQVFDKKHKGKKVDRIRPEVDVRLLLSGTPMLNRPAEMLHQLEVLGLLEEFGGWKGYTSRYCAFQHTRFGADVSGHAYLEELNEKLREKGYIRRTKAQVLKDLPDTQVSTIDMPIDNALDYAAAETDLVAYVREKALSDRRYEETIKDYPEEEKPRLRAQHAADKAERARRAKILVSITTLKQVAARGKFQGAVKWVEEFLESSDEKLVFFAWHQEIVNGIAEKFKCRAITGSVPLAARQQSIEEFAGSGGPRVIALNMQAGGVGLDGLQHSCSNVAFLELGWNDATHNQAIGRLHRIGQKGSVNAWYLLAPDTIDQWIYELVLEKRSVVTTATEGAAAVAEEPEASLLEGIIQRFEEKI